METTEIRVKKIILEIGFCEKPIDEISQEASLQDELGMDSLAAIECIVSLEKKFNITILDDELLNSTAWMQSINTITQFINDKVAGRGTLPVEEQTLVSTGGLDRSRDG